MQVEPVLARHVARLKLGMVDAQTLESFDRLLLDFVSVLLAGRQDPECRKIVAALPSVAFVYGTSAHWFDWDDTDDVSHVHGGAVIFSALLAASQTSSVSGEDFSAAAIAAYDVACRVGGFLKQHAVRGWMPTGTGATLGAAAACARVLGLSEGQILSAMGIAAANAGLSRQALADRTNAKAMLAGIAAKTAFEAALLARAGANGAPHFLTGAYGLHALHGSSNGNPGDMLAGLGTHFSINEVSVKPYPCCRSTHAVIDGVLALRRENAGFASRVDAVAARVPLGVFERCGAPFALGDSPRLSAQFSIPFTTALALARGEPALTDFAAENVVRTAEELSSVIRSVSVEASAEFGEDDALAPVALQFRAKNERVDRTVPAVSGSAAAPITPEQQRAKLRSASSGLFSEENVQLLEREVRAVRSQGCASLTASLEELFA